jgi:hypothetical protein
MSLPVKVELSSGHSITIEASSGGHLVRVFNLTEEMANCEVTDLPRLLKRPGSVIAAAPIEIRNEQRIITVCVRGKVIGQVEKHNIVSQMS